MCVDRPVLEGRQFVNDICVCTYMCVDTHRKIREPCRFRLGYFLRETRTVSYRGGSPINYDVIAERLSARHLILQCGQNS